ncbi:Holliday junction DNA helicase RuvA [Synechococcus sp. JA-2-3B'a(2-13)]|uniref:Holliday junction branch migration complex subunit RuvA n=1 Tax=Synechococcus sp. (strain JA-2-3B'a(2-13)) TaxID=321332 RepID=RUVA_SYNJB|nr:Holliday junction branch migration protein RuvA [Synechococcus sp. JA-2-3B'a(2-13)]Q2JNW8.1 RecName: Full=Holliday junction branch migration complex subunit RuvA [Synechococcus sp. JA-2-3B'a(2-13)]ABD01537.1 Holliday junction DNA helicase RuvA [Synechococcus sp. JA-2-3B'a(2-13)]
MIAFLSGHLVAIEWGERSSLTVEVQGIGYRVKAPGRFLKQLPAVGEPVRVFTHLVVRETELVLYGFGSPAERDLFVELIKVSGVGPALGLALLNTFGLPELVQAVVTENVRLLSLTPGVGHKTAQRLALELKTKLAHWRQGMGVADQPLAGGPPMPIREEVEMALLALGYSTQEIQAALQALPTHPRPTEDWLRDAITYLSQQP